MGAEENKGMHLSHDSVTLMTSGKYIDNVVPIHKMLNCIKDMDKDGLYFFPHNSGFIMLLVGKNLFYGFADNSMSKRYC